jgi:hypothetical protein
MYVLSSFDHSIHLELVLLHLEQIGISKEDLYAVPLQVFTQDIQLFDSIHHSDGISLLDTCLAWATALTVVASSYGFILRWGPIIWGLIGAVTGLVIGFIIDLLFNKNRRSSRKNTTTIHPSVIILIQCEQQMKEKVQAILQQHHAINFGIISNLD